MSIETRPTHDEDLEDTTTISVSLSKNHYRELKEKSELLGVAIEDLIRISIEEMLQPPDKDFQEATDYVLTKNAELYRRLA